METGFPSPAQGYEDSSIDLGKTLVRHPAATYCMRMGKTYSQYGIYRGDILIIDRSLSQTEGQLIVYSQGGIFKCGRTERTSYGKLFINSSGRNSFKEEIADDTIVFGVITFIIHQTKGLSNEQEQVDDFTC